MGGVLPLRNKGDMESLTDAELVERAVSGRNAAALRVLLDRHYLTIYKFAYKWCGHKQDAEDVAQEVCIRVAESLASFKGNSAFTSWLYQITLNKARDMFRARKAEQTREAGYMELSELDHNDRPDQETIAIRNQALQAIASLPEDLKSAVLLVAGEGLSHAEAARILDCAEGTISWRLSKAKEKLAQAYGGHHG